MRLIRVRSAEAMAPDSEPNEDDLLIERTLGGDGDAFAELIRRHQRKIYRTALAIVRDPAEAEAVTHDSFVQAYLKLDKFERRAGFETWLTRIAINKGRDVLRRRRLVSLSAPDDQDEPALIEIHDSAPDAERNATSRQISLAIEKAVESLSTQQKIIFRMRHFEELPLEEIASLLNLRAGTVRAHLFRAVHKVRAQLVEWIGPSATREINDEAL